MAFPPIEPFHDLRPWPNRSTSRGPRHHQIERANSEGASSSLVALDTSIEAALEPVKLVQGICKRGGDVGSRFAIPNHLPG